MNFYECRYEKKQLTEHNRVMSSVKDYFTGLGKGMVSLLKEFDSTLVGVAVFSENAQEKREQMTYKSLLKVSEIDVKNNHVKVEIGNIFDNE